ncbi:cytochrome c-type biogenesis protein [Glaciecola punicea]|uniref:cytochrome c-type biogenesis protein n=1 Tax=Glaciecola punicea TaxID=56804 RepID=UPI000AD7F654
MSKKPVLKSLSKFVRSVGVCMAACIGVAAFTLCTPALAQNSDGVGQAAPIQQTELNPQSQPQPGQTPAGLQERPKQEYAENYVFVDAGKRREFLELTAELRCPKCQNQNIADSDAPIAHDMRRKTYELMQEGKDKSQVIEWMKVRYGDFVHYQPPVNAVTIWLWVLPVLFAVLMLVFFILRRKPDIEQDIESKLARADQMLKDD